MTKTVTKNNTKNEILDAYQSLMDKMNEKESDNLKASKETEEKQKKVNEAADLSEDKIVRDIANLKINLNASLDEVESALSLERKKLSRLQEAISSETQYLDDIYEIKVNTDSLAVLIQANKEKKLAFEEEMNQKKLAFENEISEKKQQWTKEQKEKEQNQKESEEQLKKQRKREEDDYAYNLQLARKKDDDIYETKKTAQEKELTEKRATVEKDLNEREHNVVEREKELNEYKARVEAFPTEMAKAVKDTQKEITEKLEQQYQYERQLTQKDMEGEIKLLKQTIVSLENKIKEQEVLVRQLTQKTDTAGTQVKEIALKALEGASYQRYSNASQDRKEQKD